MKTMVATKMGRITIEFDIANNQDLAMVARGHMKPSEVRRATLFGIVDTGATRLVLPQEVVKKLGLPVKRNKVKVTYADGRRGTRTEVDDVRLFLMGRDGVFNAIVEPKRETALIGAIVLEDLDLLIDCAKLRLVPRDPNFVISEIE